MATFKDALGRSWSIELTVDSIRLVRSELQLDLLDFATDKLQILRRLSTDACLLVDVVSVLLSEQIKAKSLTPADFVLGMVGAGLEDAINCLVGAIADFSGPRKGAILAKLWAKIQTAETSSINQAMLRMDELDPEKLAREKFDQAFDQALAASGD